MKTEILIEPDYELPENSNLFEEVEISCECTDYDEGHSGKTSGHPDNWEAPDPGCFELTPFTWNKNLYTEIENKLITEYINNNYQNLMDEFYKIFKAQ